MKRTIKVTDPGYFQEHSDAALEQVRRSYDAQAAAMVLRAPDLAREALAIANSAWVEQQRRAIQQGGK